MKQSVVIMLLFLFVACQKDKVISINESKYLEINNTRQFVMIRGEDIRNPVLLFVHGGPGVSEIGGLRKYNRALEKDFTVVYWDQRNAGKSYTENFPVAEIKLNKYVEDVNILAQYLKKRMNVKKLLLVGHSWGSRLGMYAIQKHPEHFMAFVSSGQEVAAYEGELQSYRYTLMKAKALNKTEMVQQLEAIGEPQTGDYRTMYRNGIEGFSLQKYILLELNKEIYDGFTIEDLYANIQSDEYTAAEKENYLKSVEFSNAHIVEDPAYHNFDFRAQFPQVSMPVYFICGKYDYITPTPLAKQYFDALKAPKKEFILFENSGHDPAWEEADRFNRELIRIGRQVR